MCIFFICSSSKFIACSDIIIGIDDKVVDWKSSISISKPFESDKIKAIPIIPILDANAVSKVLPFFVFMLLNESFKAVKKFIAVFLIL